MNTTLELLMQRRTIRLYAEKPLEDEEKDAILGAAMRAPTAGAMMLYTIIEVEDPALKSRLAETCDHQPFIARAPYLLLFLADYQRWMDLYQQAGCEQRAAELQIAPRLPEEGDLLLACMDALIAAQSAVVAAESLGIGSCYIGDIIENWETHQELFGLPRWTFPIALVCFGRPAKELHNPQTKRFDRKYIVHKNRYMQFNRAELDDMFNPFGQSSFEEKEYPNGARNAVQANYLRKFTAGFSIEMTRSVRAALADWTGKP